MDIKSHLLFAKVLLTKTGKDPSYSIWSIVPDEDLGDGTLLHRYRTHRISSIPSVYNRHPELISTDKDVVVLAYISHLYLDMFNGIIFPFEMHNPVWQNPKMFGFMISNPLKGIPGMLFSSFPSEYYTENEIIFNKHSFGTTTEDITASFISKLCKYAGVALCDGIEPVVSFTGNTGYRQIPETDTTIFEEEYTNLIIKYLSL